MGCLFFSLIARSAVNGKRTTLSEMASIANQYWKDSPSLNAGLLKCVNALTSLRVLIGVRSGAFYFAVDAREKLSRLAKDDISRLMGYAKPQETEVMLDVRAEVKVFRRDLAMLLFIDRALRDHGSATGGVVPAQAISSSVKKYWTDQVESRRMFRLAIERLKSERLISSDPDWNIYAAPLLHKYPLGMSHKDGLLLVCKWTELDIMLTAV